MLGMESFSCGLDGRGFLFSDDIELPVDALSRNRDILKGWDVKVLPEFDKNPVLPEKVDTTEAIELGVPHRSRKSVLHNPRLGLSGDEIFYDSGARDMCGSMVTMNSFREEMKFESKISCSAIESNEQNASPVNMKSSKFLDLRIPKRSPSSREKSVVSMTETSSPVKRARIMDLHLQNPVCQVLGCNKDLSASKDYHKRHKVCDVHSKTARVIVNGIEQRFCQQCSRFHLLSEFDDGKRSCRKRLAGHNERRRKPQMDSYLGSNFLGTAALQRTSFLFPRVLPDSFFCQEDNKRSDQCLHIKVEEEPMPVSPFVTAGQSVVPKFLPRPKDLDVISSVEDASAGSNFSRALSLLSVQSQKPSSKAAGNLSALPLAIKGYNHPYSGIDENSTNITGVGIYQDEISAVPIAGTAVGSDIPRDQVLHPSHEDGPTMSLFELSSHLQRVEQERTSVPVKEENDMFGCYTTV